MELCDEYIHELIKIDPTLNDFFCIDKYKKFKHILPNPWSSKYSSKIYDLDEKYKKILKEKKDKTIYDKIFYRDLKNEEKQENILIYDYLPITSDDNFFDIIISDINCKGYYEFKNADDINDYINRLKVIDEITNSIIKCFKDGIKNKVNMYRENLDLLIESLQHILKNKSYIFKKNIPLKTKFNENIVKYVVKNINKLLDFLINEYYEHSSDKLGLCQYPQGKQLYKLIIKDYLYDFVTPEDIHELGLIECKRIKKEIDKIKLNCNNDLISDDKAVEIIKSLKNKLNNNLTKYFHKKLNKNNLYKVKKGNLSNSGPYYQIPNIKNKKKGTFYVGTKLNKYETKVLSLHEGLPGHHYQNFINLNNDKIPLYIKYNSTIAYDEGWGLYCENLYDYKDLCEYYFKLNYDLLRCIRLVLDTGIHYFSWTKDNCLKFHKQYIGDLEECEYKRFIDTPGRGLSYKVGELTIKFIRGKYLEKNPGKIKDFHELILNLGSLPLEYLIKEIKYKM